MLSSKDDPQARGRIDRHQTFEIEQRAVSSTTLGGIIPPAYLVDMYAKASRLPLPRVTRPDPRAHARARVIERRGDPYPTPLNVLGGAGPADADAERGSPKFEKAAMRWLERF